MKYVFTLLALVPMSAEAAVQCRISVQKADQTVQTEYFQSEEAYTLKTMLGYRMEIGTRDQSFMYMKLRHLRTGAEAISLDLDLESTTLSTGLITKAEMAYVDCETK